MNGRQRLVAIESLRDRDPALAVLIDRHGLPPLRPPVPSALRFDALARSILYQQLAGKAAAAIHARFVAALGGTVTAATVLAAPPDLLTSCGLSRAKAAAIVDLADHVVDGRVNLDRIGRLSDELVIEQLIQVRGIGRWTAEMFLLATLGRLDVWPTGDFGVRVGFAFGWNLPDVPSPKELDVLGEAFRPYRSLVAWYCWRAADDRTLVPDPGLVVPT
jgi:3-methyladenine DNA glycosylase/8-oxoguanine DNA glycosylase